jgi:arylsulfatase A-like enzyme
MTKEYKRPNILLILTDQQRLSTMSSYGDTPCITPNLDKLAEQSIRFETAYTSCPLCSPARASIMTGLFPHNHGITANVANIGCSVHELPDSETLLSRMLQQAGYICGYTGKWHLGTSGEEGYVCGRTRKAADGSLIHVYSTNDQKVSLPKDVGFVGQNFPGHGGGGHRYQEYREYLVRNGYSYTIRKPEKEYPQWCGVFDGPLEATIPYFLIEHTISLADRFTESEDTQPFFIWHNFWGPHEPYYPTAEYYEFYREVEIPEWPNYRWPSREIEGPHQEKIHQGGYGMRWKDWAEYVKYYYAFMTMIDGQIGRLLRHLEGKGVLENTLVIFTADHGETAGSHGGLFDKGFHHFEEIQRIPFLVRFPDGYRAGDVVKEFISLTDLYPTILDAAGAKVDAEDIDGRSLMPLMHGFHEKWREEVAVEFNGLGGVVQTLRTIRWRNFKYGFSAGSEEQLYDLEKDPYEMKNTAVDPEYQEILAEMRSRMLAWMEKTFDPAEKSFKRFVQRKELI